MPRYSCNLETDKYKAWHRTRGGSVWVVGSQCWMKCNLETWKTWRSEIAWNFPPEIVKNLDKTRHLAEYMDKTCNVKTYNISILYSMFSQFCAPAILECLLCLPFNAKLTAQKPGEWPFWLGQNLEITWNFVAKRNWEPCG